MRYPGPVAVGAGGGARWRERHAALDVTLDVHQSRALRLVQPGNTVILLFGRGAGKTWLDRLIIHQQALSRPGIHVGLLMPTLKQARQVFWPLLFADYYGPLSAYMVAEPNKTLLEASYRNGSRLTTWGAENADAIRGQRFDVIVQDETDEISSNVERAVIEPTFSRSGGEAISVKSGTPKRGRYGILFRDVSAARSGERPDVHVVKVRSEESPQVDQEWLQKIRARAAADPDYARIYAREYNVDFDSAEGLVYAFEYDVHVAQPAANMRFDEYLVGVDHGMRDPGVFLLIGILGSGADAVAWVLDEIYASETPNNVWDARARQWHNTYVGLHRHAPVFWCDRSRPDRIRDLVNAGVDARAADNAIDAGVARVADLLAIRETASGDRAPRLLVAPRCRNTIREFGLYKRKRDRRDPERFLDQIADGNDHTLDALRYALIERFGGVTVGKRIVSGAV